MADAHFLNAPPRFLFFTGKGGVGKTSVACATAIELAARGMSVLLVSTDPASNVGQVFGVPIGNTVTDVVAIPGLSALEIDPEQAAAEYRERIVGPVRDLLPAAELASIEEQLSGACTTEIASFNEFTDLLTDAAWTAAYDHILFDTAPTGHTIRLLQLPGSWSNFLTEDKGDASCLGPLSGLDKQRTAYGAAVDALTDPSRTRLILVSRPQQSALAEAARTQTELAAIGMTQQFLVINGVLPEAAVGSDSLATAVYLRERRAINGRPRGLQALPIDSIDLKRTNMVGIEALRGLLNADTTDLVDTEAVDAGLHAAADTGSGVAPAPLSRLVDEIAADGHGLIMLMGKGGVGKTTMAAAIAVALAEQGLPVHLSTTDPAAHLADTLAGNLPQLEVSRIDPTVEIKRYTDQILRTKGANLDDAGRAMLREDLRSPCTEEIAVFQAFARVTREAKNKFVVLDTAPTGHTLLLIDATGAYHRESQRQIGDTMNVTTPMMKLQDPAQTKVIIVTLAEPTPVLEATELQKDLIRAKIVPWAWVVNASVAAANPTSPLLRARARSELVQIAGMSGAPSSRLALVPLLAEEPVGIGALGRLTKSMDLTSVPAQQGSLQRTRPSV